MNLHSLALESPRIGQEELCFINSNGIWYKKEPNFQYQNNYQQRPYYNNQQGGYQAKQNYPQANQSPQTQGSSSKAQAPDSSVDSMFKQLLEFQARNEKTMIYEFKNIHAKIDGNYSDLNNKKEPNFQYQNNYQQRPYYNNQQGGYQAKLNYPQANQSPQTQGSSSQAQAPNSSVDSMFKQLLEFQARNEKTVIYEFKNIHARINGNYSDLNNNYTQLASHLKASESQVASMPSSSKQPMGSLPGKPEKNPKESCNIVFSTTSSEIELSDHEKEEDEIERLVFGTEFGEVERFVVATAEAHITKDAARNVEAKNLQRDEHKAEKQVEKRADNKLKEVKLEEATEIELSPYDKLPFPQRVLTKAQKKVLSLWEPKFALSISV
ncbi:hypothetical protein F2Q69_00035344 [Brassica cretica]|uniref:Uncharacterized protein n=1 Tax=Brassica cretica TaxID=69181 RepID=A0A8S9SN61_BRACR|nr:hypothetical protein F2Q69_00035344 [Brassica cretica]